MWEVALGGGLACEKEDRMKHINRTSFCVRGSRTSLNFSCRCSFSCLGNARGYLVIISNHINRKDTYRSDMCSD